MATDGDRENLFRILIATDNHLGVWEKDQVRKDDSFETFGEILGLARKLEVDFVLLGGDLFHENKPSRGSLVKGVQIFTEHCLGDNPVQFQVLSDPKVNFGKSSVNYENENLNIGLPVFTIHGNHDDPSGEGNLSAVDVLSSCGLVNYFGKSLLDGAGPGKVRLSPILLEKGTTKLALYGLGHIRDERLGRLFQTPGCVEWVRPKPEGEYSTDDWFNVFVLHQNRVQHGANAKNCVQEKYLAKFLDFIVWGHEHECLPDPQESALAKFNILQPGSSVATALSEGESKSKHVVVLEVLGDKWRTIKYPLLSARSFKFEHILLAQQTEVDPECPESVTTFLEAQIDRLIREAQRERLDADGKKPILPIVRLRVDYTGFSTINSQRLGQKYVGKVANPHDIILWSKASKRKETDVSSSALLAAAGSLKPDELDQSTIDELISANLKQQLEVLTEEDLTAAVHNFVDKDEKGALNDCYKSTIVKTQKTALNLPDALGMDTNRMEVQDTELPANEQDGLGGPSMQRGSETLGPPAGRGCDPGLDLLLDDSMAGPESHSVNALEPKRKQRTGTSTRKRARRQPAAKKDGGQAGSNLMSYLTPREATQSTAGGTQRSALVKVEEESETAGIEGDTPFRSAMDRTGLGQNSATSSRKRGAGPKILLDSEDDDNPKPNPASRRRRRVL